MEHNNQSQNETCTEVSPTPFGETDTRPILLYGIGAMARLTMSYISQSTQIAGVTVDDHLLTISDRAFHGVPLHPFSSIETICPPSAYRMLIAVGYHDMNQLRLQKTKEAKAKGYGFASYVHPSVHVHDGVKIGENTIILDHVAVHPGTTIGHSAFLSSNVSLGHDCHIGDGVLINSGASIAGGAKVGACSFLGVNASVTQGITLGASTFVGAGTLVNRDTEPESVHISSPSETVRLRSRAFLKFCGMQP